jgi:predicted outer membrane protein
MKKIRFGNRLVVGVLAVSGAMAAVAQEPASPPAAEAAPQEAREAIDIGDYHLTAWLVSEKAQQLAVGELARERASREEVQQFANQMVEEHRSLIARLHATGLVAHERPQLQVGPVLQQLAVILEQRMAANDGRIIRGFRDEATDAQRQEARERVREQRQELREERQDRREVRRDDEAEEEADVREARSQVRDARQELRAQRREAVGELAEEVLPIIRENLPMILALVGTAVEQGQAEGRDENWLRLKQRLDEQKVAAIREDLQRREGEDFDRGFLEYQRLAHVGTIATLQVFQQHASPELRPTLDESLTMARDHLASIRQLLGEAAPEAEGEDN